MNTPTLVPFNVNHNVKVCLTEKGRAVWEAHWAEALKGSSLEAPVLQTDEYGYAIFQLWDFMYIFGPEMWMGNPRSPLFQHNEIFVPITVALSSE